MPQGGDRPGPTGVKARGAQSGAKRRKFWIPVSLLAEGAPRPDLVVYLQAPTEVLIRRIQEDARVEQHAVSEEYMHEINRAYNHYFFHYNQTPLLVVNTAEIDLEGSAEDLDDVLKQIQSMGRGTQFYVPQVSNR